MKIRSKQGVYENIGNNLKQDHVGTKELLYSLAKNYRGRNKELTYSIKDKQGNLLTDSTEIAERWKEYFSELLNGKGKCGTRHG